jgi:uncharacterized protein (DUF2164 family)
MFGKERAKFHNDALKIAYELVETRLEDMDDQFGEEFDALTDRVDKEAARQAILLIGDLQDYLAQLKEQSIEEDDE